MLPTTNQLESVRADLERRLGSDPGVSLVDIGLGDAGESGHRHVSVRVHVRTPSDAARLRAEGVGEPLGPVTVAIVAGDYRLELIDDTSPTDRPREDR